MPPTCVQWFVRFFPILIAFSGMALHAQDLALTGATIYPSPEARPIPDAVVVIHGQKVSAIGARGSVTIPDDARVIDCSGKFITAGFWNSHIHLFTPVLLRAREAKASELTKELDAMLNRWGFTTAFDIASVLDNTLALRKRIESGEVKGPRILTVGEPLWTEPPVYVQDYLKANHVEIRAVTTPDEAKARVRELADEGADGIKLFSGSMQAGGKVANMSPEMVRAVAQEAHRRHLPVFAHPQNMAGLEVAISGGVDILAHTAPDSPPWTPEFVNRLKQAHMALIPTLTLFDFEARKAELPDQQREGWLQKMIGELRAYVQAGGEVLFGTDVGYTDHFDTAMEFTLMSRAGMSFPQILAALTTNPAKRFGYAARRGTLAKGMEADVVVLNADPAKEITALSKVSLSLRGGQVVYQAE